MSVIVWTFFSDDFSSSSPISFAFKSFFSSSFASLRIFLIDTLHFSPIDFISFFSSVLLSSFSSGTGSLINCPSICGFKPKSDLGLNPQIDGQLIRLPIPELNEERRTELKKLIKSIGEKCKVTIRNIRREANEELKKLLKNKEIGEDEEKSFEKNVQTITDNHIKVVDEKVSLKEKEIMTI